MCMGTSAVEFTSGKTHPHGCSGWWPFLMAVMGEILVLLRTVGAWRLISAGPGFHPIYVQQRWLNSGPCLPPDRYWIIMNLGQLEVQGFSWHVMAFPDKTQCFQIKIALPHLGKQPFRFGEKLRVKRENKKESLFLKQTLRILTVLLGVKKFMIVVRHREVPFNRTEAQSKQLA